MRLAGKVRIGETRPATNSGVHFCHANRTRRRPQRSASDSGSRAGPASSMSGNVTATFGEHHFGGKQTEIKLEVLRRYLPAYTTALKNQTFALHYIDAFAGTGLVSIQSGNARRLIPGSATIAIECRPPFHRLTFIETRRRHADALRRLAASRSDLVIDVTHGDANVELPDTLARLDAKSDRAVVFIDPYGMALRWETLEKVARSQLADVWYLFPLSGMYRQAARSAAKLTTDKITAIDRILGTNDWYEALYGPPRQPTLGLFEGEEDADMRHAEVKGIVDFVSSRLETIFPAVLQPLILNQNRVDGAQNVEWALLNLVEFLYNF